MSAKPNIGQGKLMNMSPEFENVQFSYIEGNGLPLQDYTDGIMIVANPAVS